MYEMFCDLCVANSWRGRCIVQNSLFAEGVIDLYFHY